jgi:hypothetical protein
MSKLSLMNKENKRQYLFNSVVWKSEIENSQTIEVDRLSIIDEILSTWEYLTSTNILTLVKLVKYAKTEKIKNNFYQLSSLSGNERKSRTLEMFILQYDEIEGKKRYDEFIRRLDTEKRYKEKYGEIEGNIKFNEYKQRLSVSQRKKVIREGKIPQQERSLICKEYWIKIGHTEEEAIELSKAHHLMMIEHSHKVKPIRLRINIPNTLDYWLYRGYDYTTALKMQKLITIKSIQSKEGYKKKYGDEWIEKWDDMCRKKNASYLRNLSKKDGFVCKASKQSLEYFNPLRTWLISKHNILPDDIYLGIEGSKEFFLAHSTLYYFRYDFTIRSKKIIIEYHGDRWHPSDILTDSQWKDWSSPHGISVDIQHNIDIKRKEIAETLGFKYYVIWSYKDKDQEMKNVIKFIEDNI